MAGVRNRRPSRSTLRNSLLLVNRADLGKDSSPLFTPLVSFAPCADAAQGLPVPPAFASARENHGFVSSVCGGDDM
jgi:hypothetical protein